jgi:hypothetical protein
LIALWATPFAALLLLVVVGIGNTILDVSGYTLLQRAVPEAVLGRVFAVLESLIIGSIAIGGLLEPLVINALGVKGALFVTGGLLPALAVLGWTRLREIDAAAAVPGRELELLRHLNIFRALAPPTLEELASRLVPIEIEAGREIFRQGEPGDRFYVIAEGEVEVLVDDVRVRTEGPGEFFGEIALLEATPRTATVRALVDVEVYALERDDFIAAVTGHAESAKAVNAVVTTRLRHARPAVASL